MWMYAAVAHVRCPPIAADHAKCCRGYKYFSIVIYISVDKAKTKAMTIHDQNCMTASMKFIRITIMFQLILWYIACAPALVQSVGDIEMNTRDLSTPARDSPANNSPEIHDFNPPTKKGEDSKKIVTIVGVSVAGVIAIGLLFHCACRSCGRKKGDQGKQEERVPLRDPLLQADDDNGQHFNYGSAIAGTADDNKDTSTSAASGGAGEDGVRKVSIISAMVEQAAQDAAQGQATGSILFPGRVPSPSNKSSNSRTPKQSSDAKDEPNEPTGDRKTPGDERMATAAAEFMAYAASAEPSRPSTGSATLPRGKSNDRQEIGDARVGEGRKPSVMTAMVAAQEEQQLRSVQASDRIAMGSWPDDGLEDGNSSASATPPPPEEANMFQTTLQKTMNAMGQHAAGDEQQEGDRINPGAWPDDGMDDGRSSASVTPTNNLHNTAVEDAATDNVSPQYATQIDTATAVVAFVPESRPQRGTNRIGEWTMPVVRSSSSSSEVREIFE